MCLSVAGGLLNEVWITSIKIIVHTSRQESCKQSLNELVSTLMDYFAMSTKLEDKVNLKKKKIEVVLNKALEFYYENTCSKFNNSFSPFYIFTLMLYT